MFIFDLTLVDRSRQARAVIIPSRFAADSIEASFAKNVNLCALKIGLLFKRRPFQVTNFSNAEKKREQSFLEQKHSEEKKTTKRIRLGRKRNGDDAHKEHTTDCTDQTLSS